MVQSGFPLPCPPSPIRTVTYSVLGGYSPQTPRQFLRCGFPTFSVSLTKFQVSCSVAFPSAPEAENSFPGFLAVDCLSPQHHKNGPLEAKELRESFGRCDWQILGQEKIKFMSFWGVGAKPLFSFPVLLGPHLWHLNGFLFHFPSFVTDNILISNLQQ